jgi:hypothetical protein
MPEITITYTDDAKDQLITTVLDADEAAELIKVAAHERRDPTAQAAVFIADAMGLWYEKTEPKAGTTTAARKRNRARPKVGTRQPPVDVNGVGHGAI